ncbi:Phage terminase large subunit (GpA) [Aliiroseovarius crassostreae]|uniref:Phage terminase large subunit GpA ATPase domain-containing protein n=2 Tax=Aliiroseovarius crassostreae TaxID=154981 RepID=A0A0P7IU03_9RHOB|nr:hypothetical protein AKJ29_08740 [Aliiroseovarius crassostreae]SFU64716.1 Phage terminase large subunit (GpA) [Aliiroseovarius crassostreae]
MRRTMTFGNRRIVLASTPVDAETSRILRAYEQSDQRVFEVPCPHCGQFSEILWADIKWDADKPETAHWCCPSCEGRVEDRQKAQIVAAGRWRALAPHVEGHMIPINELDFIFLNGIAVIVAVALCLVGIVFKALKIEPIGGDVIRLSV